MNILTKTSLLALTGLVLASQVADAGISITGGDLVLGFRTGTTQELVFDLGNYSNFTIGTSYSKNISDDLSSAFGASWNTLNTISWGAIGTTTTLGSTTSVVVGMKSGVGAPSNLSAASSQKVFNALGDLNQYLNPAKNGNYDSDTVDITNGAITAPLDSTSFYWTNFAAGTATGYTAGSFNQFNPATFEAGGSTLGNTSLNLYQLDRTGAGTGSLVGTFSVNSGVLNFASVPEPSTYAMMTIGGLGFLGILRRRFVKA